MTILITALADTYGKKRLLIFGALLMALAGCVFAVASNPVLLAIAAAVGTISPSGKEVGPFLSIEQAILPETTGDHYRTTLFSAYNLVASVFGAFGELAVALPSVVSLPAFSGFRLLIWGYVACAAVMMLLFACLSPFTQGSTARTAQTRRIGIQRSSGIVMKLAGLFALDAFAGGPIV